KLIKFVVSLLYKISLRFSNLVIFQNKDNQNLFVSSNIVKKKKTRIVNGSGVNMDHFLPTSYPKILTFFMLSRALHSKGIREYLEAAIALKDKYPKVRFVWLGAVENQQDSIK